MPVLEYKLLSLGAKNSTVSSFKTLVDNKLGLNQGTDEKSNVGNNLPVVHIAELDKELYDKAYSLPERNTVSLKYLDGSSKHQYGKFKGGNVYKTFEGEIDSSKKNAQEQVGWIVLDRSSEDYVLFTNYSNNESIIIALQDFEPTEIVEDFTPLYDRLKQQQFAKDESYNDDTHISTSLAATFKDDVSILVTEKDPNSRVDLKSLIHENDPNELKDLKAKANDVLFNLWKIYMAAYMSVGEFSLLIKKLSDPDNFMSKSYDLFPEQIGFDKDTYKPTANTSSYNDIQAIIYDLPLDGGTDMTDAMHSLICYQQPESVSYTSSAQYESVSPRGTQIPMQLYQSANQIDLSFTLKWHIDEVRTLAFGDALVGAIGIYKENGSLQKIADTAEDFTRPWDNGNGSLQRKLCKVILPGISEIGYISSVNINYTGSMSGTLIGEGRGSGVGLNGNYNEYKSATSDYFYSELEITFNLIVVKDVKLMEYNKSTASLMYISGAVDTTKADFLDTALETVQAMQNGAADLIAAAGGLADAIDQMAEASSNIANILA